MNTRSLRNPGVAAAFSRLALPVLAAFAALALAGCQNAPPGPPVRPVVKTMRVALESGTGNRSYPGVIVARHEVQESFRVGGRIEKRLVDVGDRVRAGQVLATLDENDLRLGMESARAERKAAVSNQEQAMADERRYATLLSKHVVSQSEYDLRHLSAEEARARLEKADRSLRLAESQLGYAKLVASADGVVTKTSAEAGQVVPQGQPVVTLARQGTLEAQADIPERRLGDLATASAAMTLWSHGDKRYRAVLRETAPAADPATRTYAVRYALPDADAAVRLGMSATLILSEAAAEPTVRVPASALLNQGQGPGLWVVAPDTGQLEFRPVTVDRYADREAFVRGRLADGEVIVVSGVQKLDAGVTVRPAESLRQEAAR